ncbi:hypothetical protein F53441_13613 [Fusarium austroafricanum]|uniref:Uncharacterized protein n=1 Tax=Fusarium austroafricanum TaxID=2364996 RepID=A0A8H4NEU0_9HYPO|nr:hypothetical protein F53441_13613 [Fusarium austroafricanum]
MKVLVFLTGEQEGLSAPITLDTIDAPKLCYGDFNGVETDLETAVDFVMALEKREEAVFGPQPNPFDATADGTTPFNENTLLYDGTNGFAKRLGWTGPLITGPSSQWVDMEKYPTWTGLGAADDAVSMNAWEKLHWIFHEFKCTCKFSDTLREKIRLAIDQ